MLLANFVRDQANELGTFLCLMAVGLAIAIHYGKKYGDANPNVKDAAKKAAASSAIELIGRIFKKK